MKLRTPNICRFCKVKLNYPSNWKKHDFMARYKICSVCSAKKVYVRARKWRINHPERTRFHARKARQRAKEQAIQHYSPTKTCIKCGYSDMRALTIDHIDGKGAEHRKQLFGTSRTGGSKFYYWLKKNSYPSGFQVLCMNCQWVKKFENQEFANTKPAYY